MWAHKKPIKKSNHQVVVLLLDLPMLLRKVQVQLQHQPRRVKRRLKLGFKMNCMIALILSFKDYLTLRRVFQKGKRRKNIPHWMVILKIIMLGLKKNLMIRNLIDLFYDLFLFYVSNFKFEVFWYDVIIILIFRHNIITFILELYVVILYFFWPQCFYRKSLWFPL